jgi:multiple sugar transport system ATP-binding protein
MPDVRLRELTKRFGSVGVLERLSLTVEDGEFLCLLGPSGTGKSMTVNLIAGTVAPTSGDVIIGDRVVTALEPRARNVAVTFQSYALYPHLKVRDNLAFPLRSPLRSRDHSDEEVAARVAEVAELLELGSLLDRTPAELSGGQRQRVALGRMLIRTPDVYLMDEPIAHLDAQLRHRMRGELKRLQKERAVTTIYATPDQLEALSMGDRVAVMNWGGKVEQLAAPHEVFERPATSFVAGFTGNPPMNLLPGEVVAGGTAVRFLGATVDLPSGANGGPPEVTVGVRPHQMRLVEPAGAALRGEVRLVERAGREAVVTLAVNGSLLKAKTRRTTAPGLGEAVGVTVPGAVVHLFDRESGARTR